MACFFVDRLRGDMVRSFISCGFFAMAICPSPPKPIRFTLDLNRADHGYLKEFALAAEVDAARIMRALIDELRSDKELAQRIREKVWEQ